MSRIQITGLLAPSRRKKHKTTRRPSTATRFELDPDDILENVATAQFISASSDGRRVYRRAENIAVPPLPNRLPAISEDENDIWPYDGLLEDEDKKESSPNPVNKRRARRYLSSDEPLKQWVADDCPDEYLDEFICLEGRGQYINDGCPCCKQEGELADFRCADCFGGELVCAKCCVRNHLHNPLHAIEKWTGEFYEPSTLADIGLRIQLGHAPGYSCSNPKPAPRNLTIIHTNGLHHVTLDYCECDQYARAGSHRQQLLWRRFFPATHKEPKSCATFAVLEQFHMQNLQGKIAGYDFYSALEKLTDNAGLMKFKDCYKSFMRMVREWQFLKMAKRAGRAHSLTGVKGTGPGELAITCPACPHPNINLPNGWENAPPGERFIYFIFLAIDACFRLKRRLVSSEKRDPGLGTGLGSFVEDKRYRKFLLTVTDQREISSCTGLSALDHANTKFSTGYATTGAGVCCCARHELISRGGVGDLQKGERYANMDYIFASALQYHDVKLHKIISYDIACQWSVNLLERLRDLPLHIRPHQIGSYNTVIPKLHVYSHKPPCPTDFSLNYLPGAGRTDGEGIERVHAMTGPVCASTKQMGPGYRHDALDAQWLFWNWQKIVGMGPSFYKKLVKALLEAKTTQEEFERFSEQQSESIHEWEQMVISWEGDHTQPNPYVVPKSGVTEADVKLVLAQNEAQLAAQGIPTVHETVNASAFIVAGLGLQEHQRKAAHHVKNTKIWTPTQKTELLELRTRLHRELARFRSLQSVYMPPALTVLAATSSLAAAPNPPPKRKRGEHTDDEEKPNKPHPIELQPLLLPSELSIEIRNGTPGIRLPISTRSREQIDENDRKIKIFQDKYNTARGALIALGVNETEIEWKELKDVDLRCMEDPEKDAKRAEWAKKKEERAKKNKENTLEVPGPGEGYRKLSWIWEGAGRDPDVSTGMHEALRVQWAQSRSRAKRWSEEVALLREEMRRVLAYFEYKAAWWMERETAQGRQVSLQLTEGLQSYARSQAQLQRDMASRFATMWAPLRSEITVEELTRLEGHVVDERDEDGMDGAEMDGAETGSEEEYIEEAEGQDDYLWDN